MRLEILVDKDLVADIDQLVGRKGRSEFIEDTVRAAIERDRRRRSLAAEDLWEPDVAGWTQAPGQAR